MLHKLRFPPPFFLFFVRSFVRSFVCLSVVNFNLVNETEKKNAEKVLGSLNRINLIFDSKMTKNEMRMQKKKFVFDF